MATRRDFIGSLIGIWCGQPWWATEKEKRKLTDPVERMKAQLRAFEQPENELYKYSIVGYTTDGSELLFPIDKIERQERHILKFMTLEVEMRVPLTFEKAALLTDDLLELPPMNFYSIFTVLKDDKLEIAYTLVLPK